MIVVSIMFLVLMIALPVVMAMLLAASLLVLAWTMLARVLSFPARRWRARRSLPDGWWSEFERAFHDYNHPELARARQKERRL